MSGRWAWVLLHPGCQTPPPCGSCWRSLPVVFGHEGLASLRTSRGFTGEVPSHSVAQRLALGVC